MKIAIIGGGIFGVTAAIILGSKHNVELFEKNDDILKSASGSNQFRVHRGYHYPRSPETVTGIIKSESIRFSFANSAPSLFLYSYILTLLIILSGLEK